MSRDKLKEIEDSIINARANKANCADDPCRSGIDNYIRNQEGAARGHWRPGGDGYRNLENARVHFCVGDGWKEFNGAIGSWCSADGDGRKANGCGPPKEDPNMFQNGARAVRDWFKRNESGDKGKEQDFCVAQHGKSDYLEALAAAVLAKELKIFTDRDNCLKRTTWAVRLVARDQDRTKSIECICKEIFN